jgi:hypothetical protein
VIKSFVDDELLRRVKLSDKLIFNDSLGHKTRKDIVNNEKPTADFLPKFETARSAVLRARQIVKENNEMISKIKSDANIVESGADYSSFQEAESFSYQDSYAFDLYKIKSTNGIKDFIKDIFGVH